MAAGKIDLKARLGKKSLAPEGAPAPSPSGLPPGQPAPGPAFPAPGAAPTGFGAAPGVPGPSNIPAPMGSRPPVAPSAPAPQGFPPPGGLSGAPAQPVRPAPVQSIPAPPGFANRPVSHAPAAAPAARPTAAPAVVAAQPSPLGLKLDSDELLEVQKAGSSKAKVMALGAGIAALIVGFGIGSLYNGNQGAKAAMEGAGLLVTEITAANDKATEMNDLLKEAAKKIKGGAFPAEEVEKLGALDIPFDGSNLMNKGIGRYNSTAMTLLLQYSTAVQNAKEQKDKVRRLLGGLKGHLENIQAEKENPQFHWGVRLESTPMGPIGKMQPIKPVAIKTKDDKYRWPKEFEFGTSKLARYEGGDLKGDAVMIPVEPETETAVCPENIAFRAMGAVLDTARELEGDQTPGHERAGVIDLGKKTIELLKKINTGGAS